MHSRLAKGLDTCISSGKPTAAAIEEKRKAFEDLIKASSCSIITTYVPLKSIQKLPDEPGKTPPVPPYDPLLDLLTLMRLVGQVKRAFILQSHVLVVMCNDLRKKQKTDKSQDAALEACVCLHSIRSTKDLTVFACIAALSRTT